MKIHSSHLLAAVLALTPASSTAIAANEPGRIDFGRLTGPERGEIVEINLGRGMLKLASTIAKCHGEEIAGVIGGLSEVRVNVVELDRGNRAETTERIHALRSDLARQGWEQIVMARGNSGEDAAVYIKQTDGEVIEGLVVTVIDRHEERAVFVNIVGRIKPEQIAAIGEHLDIEPLRDRGARRSRI